MSKTVRIKEHLAAEVDRLAKEERRSLANMVEILLEQALRMDGAPVTREDVQMGGLVRTQISTTPRTERRREDPPDAHFKPDFK